MQLVAPGNGDYCKTQCQSFCDDAGSSYGQSGGATSSAAPAAAASPMQMNNGIFGDSGVSYSKGVEDLLSSAFGATRQSKPLQEADVDAYTGEIFQKATKAFLGGQ